MKRCVDGINGRGPGHLEHAKGPLKITLLYCIIMFRQTQSNEKPAKTIFWTEKGEHESAVKGTVQMMWSGG